MFMQKTIIKHKIRIAEHEQQFKIHGILDLNISKQQLLFPNPQKPQNHLQ